MTPIPTPPIEVEALMKQLRLPHARAIAADVLALARAQRWDPAEVITALLTEESAGRARSMLASRRKAANFPIGKAFDIWDESASSVPIPTQHALQTLEWVSRRENLVVCGPAGTGKTFLLEALGQKVPTGSAALAACTCLRRWFSAPGPSCFVTSSRKR